MQRNAARQGRAAQPQRRRARVAPCAGGETRRRYELIGRRSTRISNGFKVMEPLTGSF